MKRYAWSKAVSPNTLWQPVEAEKQSRNDACTALGSSFSEDVEQCLQVQSWHQQRETNRLRRSHPTSLSLSEAVT